MPHKVIYNCETKIIEITVTGEMTFDTVKQVYSEILDIIKKEGTTLLLGDFRESISKISTLEIYEMPRAFAKIASSMNINLFNTKRAVVLSEIREDFRFYENVANNRGLSEAKLFTDIEKAKKWLLEK